MPFIRSWGKTGEEESGKSGGRRYETRRGKEGVQKSVLHKLQWACKPPGGVTKTESYRVLPRRPEAVRTV